MKHKFELSGIGLAMILFSSAAFAQNTSEAKDAGKTRHIKMTKIENGKEMKLDTVITGDDVFVWNGDTINPVKHIKKFGHSGFGKMKHLEFEVGGDSVREKIIVRKRLNGDGEEDHVFYFDGPKMKHFSEMPPMPPMPGVPHMKMLKRAHSGEIIDLNDPNIISFRKKKLSGGREKIEIIREKPDENSRMSYDIEMNDAMMSPEPPEPPVFMGDFGKDNSEKKIIRKEISVEEKDGKEIDNKVGSEKNK